MMDKNTVNFQLFKIATEQFAVVEDAFKEKAAINLQAGIDFKINLKNRLIACFTRFQFLIDNAPFLILNVRCEFVIKEDSWNSFVDQEKKVLNLKKGLLRHLAVLSVGTSRGILHAKTESTRFNQFYLPTININDFVKKDLVFPFEQVTN